MRSNILLNPGPVKLTDRVRKSLLRDDQCHRENAYAELMLDIIKKLSYVYPQSKDNFIPITLTGSGTCAVEAMLSSFAPKSKKTLVVCNGVYGERMASMLMAQCKPYIVIKNDWLSPIDFDKVNTCLESDSEISHIVAVQNETTTGRLNDITTLGAICKKNDKALLLDAVSSFGAEELDFEKWNLQAVAATANKCLHAAPGMAFVLADRSIMEFSNSYANTLYLDLYNYYKVQKTGFSPFTPAVHASYTLHEALQELEENGGWHVRHDVYKERSQRITEGLLSLGVETLLSLNDYSSMITSFLLPKNMNYTELHDKLLTKGFVIYSGQGRLFEKAFRVATMGDINNIEIDELLSAFDVIIGSK